MPLLSALAPLAVAGNPISYVKFDATGANDGTSWADAYLDLQSALAAALPGDEIWVATGVYKPAKPGGPAESTFQLRNLVAIYGGFVGTEASRDERNPTKHNTTLHGNLNGSDALHVVSAAGTDSSAILDGFTVTGGDAAGNGPNGNGGGIFCDGGAPLIVDCVITGNRSAHDGAGVFACQGEVSRCIIVDNNNAQMGFGGGLFDCDGFISNCIIADNVAYRGGGLYNCDAAIINCEISNNFGDESGGGFDRCHGPISGSLVASNRSGGNGGGLRICDGIIRNCTIAENRSDSRGGGLFDCGGGVFNTILRDNVGHFSGAMENCSGPIVNCVIAGNTASTAHALYNCDGLVVNCTILGNIAQQSEGGALQGCEASIRNTILWGNTPLQIASGSPDIMYSDVQGGFPGLGNIELDPQFVGIEGRLSSTSPCIDAGSNAAIPPDFADVDGDGILTELTPLDVDRQPRFADHCMMPDTGEGIPPVVDLGAYEFPAQRVACDTNCDGSVNINDTQGMIDAILVHSACSPCAGDINQDGSLNQFDIAGFVACISE